MVTWRAKEVPGKVAKVLEAQPKIEFVVEDHAGNVILRGSPSG